MNYSVFRFTLNMHSHRSQASVSAFQGDTGIQLRITLTDGGNSYFIEDGCIAILSGTKADGTKLWNRCVIENNTTIRYDFTEQTTSCVGVANCEIILYGADGNIITAPKFVIVVDEREVGYDDIIETETEKNALDLAMSAAAGEEARVTAEASRELAEADRVSAEDARELAEARREEAKGELSIKVAHHEKRITNLEQGLPTDLFESDSTIAYRKDVPSDACPYAEIIKIGGMSRRCENLIPYPYRAIDSVVNSVSFTVFADGAVKVSGTASADINVGLWYPTKNVYGEGTYTISGGTSGVVILARKYNSSGSNASWIDSINGSAKTGTLSIGESVAGVNMYISSGTTVNATVYPMLNYGSTALPYAPYFEGLRHTKVTQLVSRDGEENIIDTFEIPEEIQSLPGYGLGVDVGVANETYSNEIVVNIETNKKEYRAYCEELIIDGSEGRLYTSGGYKNCWCIDYRNKPRNKIMMGVTDKYKYLTGLSGTDDGAYLRITQDLLIRDARFTDTATAQDILSKNPVRLVLAFQEPIVTDVSDKFPEDNFIKVEGGGYLTFENTNNLPSASTIMYQIKEA